MIICCREMPPALASAPDLTSDAMRVSIHKRGKGAFGKRHENLNETHHAISTIQKKKETTFSVSPSTRAYLQQQLKLRLLLLSERTSG